MKLEGKVFSGEGEASEFLELEPYAQFIKEQFGEFFPGTLNLRIIKAGELREKSGGERLESFCFQSRDYGGLTLYPISFEGRDAAVIKPDRSRYGEEVIEVVAEKRLRDELDLEDGDTVEVRRRVQS